VLDAEVQKPKNSTSFCYRGVLRGGPTYMETLHCINIESAAGPLFLAASGKGLVALEFDTRLPGQQSIRPNPRHLREERQHFQFEDSSGLMQRYSNELEEYFSGQRRQFTFPLDLRGTAFQLACWNALLAI
jgi:O6-methylguanine-DNA--protein-cysteine methyltransferase